MVTKKTAKKKTPKKSTKATSKKAVKKPAAKTKRKTTRKKTKQTSWLKFTIKWLFVLGLWCGIALTGLIAWYAQDLPDITKSAAFERKLSITIKDSRGKIVSRYGDIIGNQITTEDIPPTLVQAVLAIEDRRFYDHPGLDPLGLARAIFINTKEGRVVQGGSTITQQLAKNLFLSRERTYKRKIQEALLAFWLEYELSKDEILAAYLNRVYLGSGTYGVDAAARRYFDTPASEISLRQSATLAGLLKAPSRYSPLRNPSLSRQRTEVVLGAMVAAGYITEAQAKGQSSIPPKPTQKPSNEYADRYFTDWIVDELGDLIGTPTEDLIIETTLNSDIQNKAIQVLDKTIAANAEAKNMSEGAIIIMRPNGEVVALVGGRNYSRSEFNRATQALRPPGSAFKPFVYLTALEQGWDIHDTIMDEPITDWRYKPKNFGGKYYGEVTLEESLTYSMNTAAVRLMKETGAMPVLNTAQRLGITSDIQPDLSLALGSSGITLLEMANAYAILANGGLSVRPQGINKITSTDGELYYQRPRSQKYERVFNEFDIQNVRRMMTSVMEYGTGRGASFGVPAAGKTGTSDNSRDAMFMGFTDQLVGVVWLGNDDNSPMNKVTGGSHPAQIWREVMGDAYGKYPSTGLSDFVPASTFENMLDGLFFGGNKNDRNPKNDNAPITQQKYKERFNN
jgi:penicillin-binding protein 1A